jgi:hypothetical protein
MSRLGDHARHSLTEREQQKINDHLLTCTKCAIISEEVDEVGSHLAMVMIPLVLGASVGGLLLASFAHAGMASAATVAASALPAAPASFTVLAAPATFAPAVTAGLSMGAATGVSAVVGSIAVVAAVGGGVALGLAPQAIPAPQSHTTIQATAPTNPGAIAALTAPPASSSGSGGSANTGSGVLLNGGLLDGLIGDGSDGSTGLGGTVGGVVKGIGNTVGGVTNTLGNTVGGVVGGVTNNVVDPLLGSLTPGASPSGQDAPGGAPVTTNITISGTGTPGATVAAQVGGIIYGTAKVNSDGSFTLLVTALPSGSGPLNLSQTLTVLGIKLPINIPLKLNTGGLLGTVVNLLN